MLPEPTIKTVIENEPVCHVPYQPQSGRASVMNDNMLELLTKASKLYDPTSKTLPIFSHVILTVENARVYADVWAKAGGFKRLPFSIGARVDCEFKCAVHLDTFMNLLAVERDRVKHDKYNRPMFTATGKFAREKMNDRAYRIDLKYNPKTCILNIDGGNWKTNLKAIGESECPVAGAPIETEYSKEQQTEFTWLKKAVAKSDSRPVLNYANVQECGNLRCAVASDGYRVHVTMNHVAGLPVGLLDIQNFGKPDSDLNYPELVNDVFEVTTDDKVQVYREDLITVVKTALANVDNGNKNNPIQFTFSEENIASIASTSFERGEVVSQFNTSGTQATHTFAINGKFILDAIAGSKADKIMFSFSKDNTIIRLVVAPGRAVWIIALTEKKEECPEPTTENVTE